LILYRHRETLSMSKRAGSTVVEVKGSHAVYVSQPRAVAHLIKSLLPRASRLAINLQLGERPPSRFCQVAPDGDHRLLVILSPFDPLIQPYDMGSREPTLLVFFTASSSVSTAFFPVTTCRVS
jgi:hypothetical protein